MSLQRKNSAKFSRSRLLENYNDIDIYIEDTAKNYDKLYLNIFKRVFGGTYQIDNIYPIGSRGNVINKCKEKSVSVKRPMLFVVDGDLYLLKGEKKLPLGVFRLPYYCVENLLLDKNAIISFINEEHMSLREEEIVSKFSYPDWKLICENPLTELFIIYAIIQKTNIQGVPNVSIPVSEFRDDKNNSIINKRVISQKILELEAIIVSKIGQAKLDELKTEMNQIAQSSHCKLSTYVSGKDYLYPLIYEKISEILNRKVSHMNFKQRLALKCDISKIMDSHNTVLTPAN